VRIEHSRSAQNPRFRIHQIGITPDGQTLVITSNQNEVYVRDLQTLEPVGAPIEGTDYSGGVEFSRDGSLVAIGGFGTISIYRLDRPERALAVFEVPGDVNDNRSAVVVDLEFSEDDRFLIVGSTYSASVFELPIHWGDPDPAAYLDVVQLEEASGALEWNLANRSLFPPADPRMFVPLHEVYLPTLKGATSSQELAGALFDHYLSRGFLQAAQGVLLSMEEEASEEMWTQWREASSRAAED
jgi:WD40 repeat protein